MDRYYIRWSNVADPSDGGEGYSPITGYEVANLQPGATYAFNVAAENRDGISSYSEPAQVTLDSGAGK